ncbi:MAG: hypothetical protein QE271_04005 [Bacteriovoracaceae bacterium]|nr:hypothetical protein [Bacteriovoracaceae bacterium]
MKLLCKLVSTNLGLVLFFSCVLSNVMASQKIQWRTDFNGYTSEDRSQNSLLAYCQSSGNNIFAKAQTTFRNLSGGQDTSLTVSSALATCSIAGGPGGAVIRQVVCGCEFELTIQSDSFTPYKIEKIVRKSNLSGYLEKLNEEKGVQKVDVFLNRPFGLLAKNKKQKVTFIGIKKSE